ncbi:MAG: hypothetical protein ACHQIL_03375 [Steroidobacterales bacterium]
MRIRSRERRAGAAHGLELAFLFGTFTYSFIRDNVPVPDDGRDRDNPLRELFSGPDVAGRERLSAAMMSYWGQFARSGDPGTGTAHDLPACANRTG